MEKEKKLQTLLDENFHLKNDFNEFRAQSI